jgi:hypothetical protein
MVQEVDIDLVSTWFYMIVFFVMPAVLRMHAPFIRMTIPRGEKTPRRDEKRHPRAEKDRLSFLPRCERHFLSEDGEKEYANISHKDPRQLFITSDFYEFDNL